MGPKKKGKGTTKGKTKTKNSTKTPKAEFETGVTDFLFPNGDKYSGAYMAHRSGLVWREGHGVYMTHDGQLYEGEWKNDKLEEGQNLMIAFPNEDIFDGKLVKNKYNGPGTYAFNNGTYLACNFANNKPVGDLIFIDNSGDCWYGSAEEERALFFQEHVFSMELDSERGKAYPSYPKLEESDTKLAQEPEKSQTFMEEPNNREEEARIFAKSKKTPSDIDFEDSDWLRDYREFEKISKAVFEKIKFGGVEGLDKDEREWYDRYLLSRKLLEKKRNKFNVDASSGYDLLGIFFSEEYRKSSRPIRVFYPSPSLEKLPPEGE